MGTRNLPEQLPQAGNMEEGLTSIASHEPAPHTLISAPSTNLTFMETDHQNTPVPGTFSNNVVHLEEMGDSFDRAAAVLGGLTSKSIRSPGGTAGVSKALNYALTSPAYPYPSPGARLVNSRSVETIEYWPAEGDSMEGLSYLGLGGVPGDYCGSSIASKTFSKASCTSCFSTPHRITQGDSLILLIGDETIPSRLGSLGNCAPVIRLRNSLSAVTILEIVPIIISQISFLPKQVTILTCFNNLLLGLGGHAYFAFVEALASKIEGTFASKCPRQSVGDSRDTSLIVRRT